MTEIPPVTPEQLQHAYDLADTHKVNLDHLSLNTFQLDPKYLDRKQLYSLIAMIEETDPKEEDETR